MDFVLVLLLLVGIRQRLESTDGRGGGNGRGGFGVPACAEHESESHYDSDQADPYLTWYHGIIPPYMYSVNLSYSSARLFSAGQFIFSCGINPAAASR